MPQFLFLF